MSDDIHNYNWADDVDVKTINVQDKKVTLSNGYTFNHKEWYEHFVNFWDKRVVGKTIVPTFYEYLFARGGSHQYAQLATGFKHQGVLEGQMGKPMLNKRNAIAVTAILTLLIGGVIALVILKNQGLIPGF